MLPRTHSLGTGRMRAGANLGPLTVVSGGGMSPSERRDMTPGKPMRTTSCKTSLACTADTSGAATDEYWARGRQARPSRLWDLDEVAARVQQGPLAGVSVQQRHCCRI